MEHTSLAVSCCSSDLKLIGPQSESQGVGGERASVREKKWTVKFCDREEVWPVCRERGAVKATGMSFSLSCSLGDALGLGGRDGIFLFKPRVLETTHESDHSRCALEIPFSKYTGEK